MKRIIALLLCVLMAASVFSGCTPGEGNPSGLNSFHDSLTGSGYTFVTTTGPDGTTTVELVPPTSKPTGTTKPTVSGSSVPSVQPSTGMPLNPTGPGGTGDGTDQPASTVTVPQGTTEPERLQLARADLLMTSIGATFNLAAGNIDPVKITWISQNEDVATVKNGVVTAVGMGMTRIYASYKDQTMFCTVSVQLPTTDPAPVLKLRYSSLVLLPGSSQSIYDGTIPANTITWTSSNAQIVSVSNGVVSALKPGSVTVYASYRGQTAHCAITVQQPTTDPTTAPQALKLNPATLSLKVGQFLQYTDATVGNIPVNDITWTSDDATIASVVNGKVTGLKPGQTYIRASWKGQTVSAHVVVQQAAADDVVISLTHRYLTVQVGSSVNIYTGNVPAADVQWIVDNAQIVSVNNGVITALKPGQAIIRAKYLDKSAFCTITVQQVTTDPTTAPTTKPTTTTPTTVNPATHAKVDYTKRYIYNSLSSQEQGWYRAIDTAVKNLQDTVQLSGDFSDPKWYTIYFAYMFDNPEHFYLGARVAYSSNGRLLMSYADGTSNSYHGGAANGDLENLTDTMRQNIRSRKAAFDAEVNRIISAIPVNIPDVEKELMLYDRLLIDMYYNQNAEWDKMAEPNWTAYGGIILKHGVCEAYAEAFQTLCYAVGINCTGVIGTAKGGGHKWNAVYIGGDWYQCDLTFDDPLLSTGGEYRPGVANFHSYFNITSAKIAADHAIDGSDFPGPTCTATKYSYKNYFG